MVDDPRTIINETFEQVAENLPLFGKITLSKGPLSGTTPQEMHTVWLIGRMGSPKMSELARRGHVTFGTMTVMVSKLVRKGFVRRMRDDEDRRVVRVSLTPRGKKADKLHQEFHNGLIEQVLGVLTPSEQRQVAKLIRKIVTSLG